jgi:hypothetical protein
MLVDDSLPSAWQRMLDSLMSSEFTNQSQLCAFTTRCLRLDAMGADL